MTGHDRNLIIFTDSYKITHHLQMPPWLRRVLAYLTARYSSIPGVNSMVAYYAMRYYLDVLFTWPIGQIDIEEAEDLSGNHFGTKKYFNRKGWEDIVNKYGGHLPLEVRAWPEGTRVQLNDPFLFIKNLDEDNMPWLSTYIEPMYMKMRKAIDVATISDLAKQTVMVHLIKSGTPATIDYRVHDFGFRAPGHDWDAIVGGSAHLVSFKGTDTFPALPFVRDYYNEPDPGHSVYATEHSTMMAWLRGNQDKRYWEDQAIAHNLRVVGPDLICAQVMDTNNVYEAFKACYQNPELKALITSRNMPFVGRPDSGDACTQIPELLNIWGEGFGFTVNEKGYKVLPPYLRIISGDGHKIKHDLNSIDNLYTAIENAGWSADNLTVGFGGGLLDGTVRDTFGWAVKECGVEYDDGTIEDRCKNPVDMPSKRSRTYSEMKALIDQMPLAYRWDGKGSGPYTMPVEDWATIRARVAEFYTEAV